MEWMENGRIDALSLETPELSGGNRRVALAADWQVLRKTDTRIVGV